MKIGIDFHSAERDGSGNCTYVRNLVEAILKTDKSNNYFLYITDVRHPYFERFRNLTNVLLVVIPGNNPFVRIPLLGLRTFTDKIDVLHMQYIAPPFYRNKMVLMIHDLAHFHYPQCFSSFERIRSRFLIPINAKKADCVLTGSNYSKEDIIKTLKISTEKVVVTYDGIDGERFRPIKDVRLKDAVLKKYGIDNEFILSVGRLDPRKNLPRLILAYEILKKKKNIKHNLVIVGKKGYLFSETESIVRSLGSSVIMTGFVDADELAILYNTANVFVYPSLFEGFGLPCLEAMACGCPVISSNLTSIPEVVADAGLLVNPLDTDELAGAIYKVISDPGLRTKMCDKGLAQSKLFNWENTARKTLEVYKNLQP